MLGGLDDVSRQVTREAQGVLTGLMLLREGQQAVPDLWQVHQQLQHTARGIKTRGLSEQVIVRTTEKMASLH